MENIFLKKSYTKCRIENSPGLFFKKSKLGISVDRQKLCSLNLLLVQVEDYQNCQN